MNFQNPTLDGLVEYGGCTPEVAAVLKQAVHDRKNIMVIGALRTGKTTLLDALSHEMDTV